MFSYFNSWCVEEKHKYGSEKIEGPHFNTWGENDPWNFGCIATPGQKCLNISDKWMHTEKWLG